MNSLAKMGKCKNGIVLDMEREIIIIADTKFVLERFIRRSSFDQDFKAHEKLKSGLVQTFRTQVMRSKAREKPGKKTIGVSQKR